MNKFRCKNLLVTGGCGFIGSNFISKILNSNHFIVNIDSKTYASFDSSYLQFESYSNYAYPINIGNDDEITINEIASIIKILLNSNSKIIYNELPEDDPLKRRPDISLAKKILKWNPNVCKEIGFKHLINYYRVNKLI